MTDHDAPIRRPAAHAPASLDADQAVALNRLTAALAEHLDAGESIPCHNTNSSDWISDRRTAHAA